MDFFSITFIIFLLSSLVLFYLAGLINLLFKKVIIPQWLILLAASLIFYGFNNWLYLVFIGGSSLISYLSGLMCKKDKATSKTFMIISIVINVGVLAVLKYFNFFSDTITSLFRLSRFTYNFIIPLGISFYTFSLVAYNVDCYKKEVEPEKNPFKFLLFVSYFPKVLQGPISSYNILKEDGLFAKHSFLENRYLNSLFKISIGLIKKIAIANVINIYVNDAFNHLSEIYGVYLVFVVILYAIQLYCDFSGFMDITIGISGLFGIRLEENFNAPYLSTSIQEFWRRWHITLGAWLRKYIYIPLGGNKVILFRWMLNTMIVWLVSGIWHGANWNYVLWGLYHGFLIVMFSLGTQIRKRHGTYVPSKEPSNIKKALYIVRTFALVCFGWIFFRCENISEIGTCIINIHKIWKIGSYSIFTLQQPAKLSSFFIVALVMIVLLICIYLIINYKEKIANKYNGVYRFAYPSKLILTSLLMSASIFVFLYFYSMGSNASSFIYFNF